MKKLLLEKYHILACGIIVLLFLLSVQVRRENMSLPLSRHHEWLTAHTLITCEIWAENGGPSAYHFSPVYTYPGQGNTRIRMLGGVNDARGNVYYVSYPPLSFLFAYYATQVLGGPDTDSIRQLSLAVHLLCALLIYFIGVAWSKDDNRYHISIAGMTGAFLYLFSAGNLWFHGNLYFADMLVQLFVISALFLISRFLRQRYRNERIQISLLFAAFFLASFTEWLGVFLSFYAGLAFIGAWVLTKERRFLKAFLSVGVAASLAVTVTVWQYSSIAGWDHYSEISQKKYTERSGHGSGEKTPGGFTIDNEASYDMLIRAMDDNYKMAGNFTGIFFLVLAFVVSFRRTRRRLVPWRWHAIVMLVFATALLTHYYLFFNFNAIHDFSSLKTGFFMILAVVLFISLTESMLSVVFRRILFVVVTLLAVDKGMASVERYKELNPVAAVEWSRVRSAAVIRAYSRPEVAVFTNIRSSPELVYNAKHNVVTISDTSEIAGKMSYSNWPEGQYYHHSNDQPDFILEFRLTGEKLLFTNKIGLRHNSDNPERHFQK